MGPITYFKRYRMDVELTSAPPPGELPPGYSWLAWDERLLEAHAEVKFRCFQGSVDTLVFPNLATPAGCRLLMHSIRRRPGFLPAATWLLTGPDGPCGTVQGLCEWQRVGSIQNLGIVPGLRDRGLGTTLLLRALQGFRLIGCRKAFLEVTARNAAAVRLYRRLGFRCTRTLYKAVELPTDEPCVVF
jgi:GNAT superfamily N-acetyltransferase